MSELLKISKSYITEEKGFNTRYDLGDLRELKSSMAQKGFDPSQPVIVRNDPKNKGKYLLGAQGHRRLAAAMDTEEVTHVFAVLEDESISDADRNLDIIRLNTGEPLTLLAQARVVVRALEVPDVTQGEVAKLLGKSAMFVTNCVKLSKTTKQTQKWIEGDKIAATEVLEIIDSLGAKDEEGFKKVEEKVEKLIAKANESGKKKVKSKDVKDAKDEEEETEEEKAAREKKEKEEAAVKSANKARMDMGKRAQKFVDNITEMVAKVNDLPKEDQLTPFQSALLDLNVAIASFLAGKGTDSSRAFVEGAEAGKMSDVGAAQRALEKAHKETLKETVAEVKEEAKEQVNEVKSQVKATKEEAAKKIAEAKAKAAAKK